MAVLAVTNGIKAGFFLAMIGPKEKTDDWASLWQVHIQLLYGFVISEQSSQVV